MKKATVTWKPYYGPEVFAYFDDDGSFCWLNKLTPNSFEQITSWSFCREEFIGELSRHYRGSWKHDKPLKTISMNVGFNKPFPDNDGTVTMERSLKVIHVLEDYIGWKRSSLFEAVRETRNKCTVVYVFSGTSRWMHSPQLLSLYLLCIRLGILSEHFGQIRSIDDIDLIAKKIEKATHIGKRKCYGIESNFLRTYRHWKKVLDNKDLLFFKRTAKTNFNLNGKTNGIYSLTTGISDKVMTKRWHDIFHG